MNLEFHYYIIYILCRNAEIDDTESQIIAYSSQYIDNNLVSYNVDLRGKPYETIPTQNYGWWNDYYPKNVYVPFHFFPGDPDHPEAARKDGKKNIFNCTPGSARVKELLIRGLNTRNPYRVGIALHTFADSFAHQNFSGLNEKWNQIDTGTLIPHIGHAQVQGSPDRLTERWSDPRLAGGLERIDNKTRFLEAARKIYKYLCTYNHRDFEDHEFVLGKIERLTRGIGKTSREERISNYIIEEDLMKYDKYEWLNQAVYYPEQTYEDADGFIAYDTLLWLKDALLYKNQLSTKPVLKPRDEFEDSHWFRWHEAAKAHLNEGRILLQDI